MLEILVIKYEGNCKYAKYTWESLNDFICDMKSKNINVPSLDDPLVEVETQNEKLNDWWRNSSGFTVGELLEECIKIQTEKEITL